MRRIRENVKEEEAERERVRERERDVIWMQATFQGAMSFPSPCLCFRGLLDRKATSGLLHEIFTLSWPVSRNMSFASSSPCLAPMSSQRTRGVGQVKWHPLFSLSGKDPSYWNGSSEGVLPQSFLDVIFQGTFIWVFGMISFLSKGDSVLYIRVRQSLRKYLNLKCHTCYQRSIMIEKIGFPSVWSCLPSERCSPRCGHGTDNMTIEPRDQTTSPWGMRCGMGHNWDILNLKPWEFNDGHQEHLLWRYVEVDGKEDPSEGWSSWMNTIISICRLIATILLRLPS